MVIIHKKEKGRKFATLLYANPTPSVVLKLLGNNLMHRLSYANFKTTNFSAQFLGEFLWRSFGGYGYPQLLKICSIGTAVFISAPSPNLYWQTRVFCQLHNLACFSIPFPC